MHGTQSKIASVQVPVIEKEVAKTNTSFFGLAFSGSKYVVK